MVPCTVDGSRPMFSIMSISPQVGQPTVSMSLPNIQNAGQTPCPRGILIRASKRPYLRSNFPFVINLAEVYWHGPYQQLSVRGGRSLTALITSEPEPSRKAFSV